MVNVKLVFKCRTNDGETLLVSSTDGFCSVLSFSDKSLGEIAERQPIINVKEIKLGERPEKKEKENIEGGAVNILKPKKRIQPMLVKPMGEVVKEIMKEEIKESGEMVSTDLDTKMELQITEDIPIVISE
jgi:hypothetical protein